MVTLQSKLLFYGTLEIFVATRHKGTENWPLQLKEQHSVFLALFISFENLFTVLSHYRMSASMLGQGTR